MNEYLRVSLASARVENNQPYRKTIYISLQNLIKQDGEDFIDAVYADILGRKADKSGKTHHLTLLEHGTSKHDIINAFLQSDEAQNRNIQISDGEIQTKTSQSAESFVHTVKRRIHAVIKRL